MHCYRPTWDIDNQYGKCKDLFQQYQSYADTWGVPEI
jgi:hypothetical protein